MGSLADLNTYAQQLVEYTDARDPNVVFEPPTQDNYSIIISGFNIPIQRRIEIIEIIDTSGSLNLTYSIDVSSVAGASVDWDTIPAGCTLTVAAGTYTISGIDTVDQWNVVKDPNIIIPLDFQGTFEYTVTIGYTTNEGLQEVIWQVGNYLPIALLTGSFGANINGDRVKLFNVELEVASTMVTEIVDILCLSEFTLACDGRKLKVDPYAEYLELALPFNNEYQFDDVSYLYVNNAKTSSITNTVATPGNLTIDSSFSKFYGESYFATSGAGDKTKYITENTIIGDYTIEFWVRATKTTLDFEDEIKAWTVALGDSGSPRVGFNPTTNGFNFFSNNLGPDTIIPLNTTDWVHIAITNDGWWKNGVYQGTSSWNIAAGRTSINIGQQTNGDSNDFEGNLQDFKLYVGVKKYTTATSYDEDAYGNIVEYIEGV